MNLYPAITALCLCLLGSPAVAEDAHVPSFLLMPVRTELQRSLVSGVDAYGVVNFSRINAGGRIDATVFDPEAFKGQLAEVVRGGGRRIRLYARFENGEVNKETDELLWAAIKQLCREAGIKRVLTGQQFTGSSWEERVKQLETFDEKSDAGEPLVADGLVRIWPVRTPLSHFLTNGSDCVVHVRRPIDGRMSEFPKTTRQSITNLMGTLTFKSRGKLLFKLSSTSAGAEFLDEWMSRGIDDSVLARIARDCGFETVSYTHSANGGAPETLLDAPAPDFTLEALEGGELQLKDAIRGRVALITFWGVACGPCRVEAPHLSRLYNKYKDVGLTVIGVNAYDETRQTVAEYVCKAQLDYPIALTGRKVAQDQYAVGAYPTTFWVNRSGKVVDYVVGFAQGDEVRIEADLETLLKAPGKASP